MVSEIFGVFAFVVLCVWISWMHANMEENIHICEKSGNVLFLTDEDYEKLRSVEMGLDTFDCKEKPLKRQELWDLKRAYNRSRR